MGKKKKRGQKDTQIICYYCDRTFIDETTLILHQRAKHFKCGECHKKMTTAPSLAVHCTHVHKTVLKAVPGALPGRDAIDLEIFGMAGVPEEAEQEEAPADPGGLDEEQRAKMARLAAPPLPAGQPGAMPPTSHTGYYNPSPQSWQPGPHAVHGGFPPGAPVYASAGPPTAPPYGSMPYPHAPPPFLPLRPGYAPPGLPISMPYGGQHPAISHALGAPVQPLFPIARPQEAAPSLTQHAIPAAQGKPQDPVSDANVIWAEETISMEEVRAGMTKYKAQ